MHKLENYSKTLTDNFDSKEVIDEYISLDKAQQLYNEYVIAMKILEDC